MIADRIILGCTLGVFVLVSLQCTGLKKFIRTRLDPPKVVSSGKVKFQYYSKSAKTINLAGNFNGWGGLAELGYFDVNRDSLNDEGRDGDEKAGDGIWTIIKELKPGGYQYKFVINTTIWEKDPSNFQTATEGGVENSFILVRN